MVIARVYHTAERAVETADIIIPVELSMRPMQERLRPIPGASAGGREG
jgi:hypothetical protein